MINNNKSNWHWQLEKAEYLARNKEAVDLTL